MLPSNVTILDGGTGRELMRLGAPFRQPEWSALALMEAPHFVELAHSRFLAAGARVITANSYAVCPFHLGDAVFAARGGELAALAGVLAKKTADAAPLPRARVAGSLPPTCGSYRADLFDADVGATVLRVLIPALAPYVDVWLAETLSAVAEAELVVAMLTEGGAGGGKPTWLSFTLADSAEEGFVLGGPPRLRSGETVAAAAAAARRLGAAALLFNCCQGEAIGPAVDAAREALAGSGIAIGAYANAFAAMEKDALANDGFSDIRKDYTPETYGAMAQDWVSRGATMVGGCCGIGPEFIAHLAGKNAPEMP